MTEQQITDEILRYIDDKSYNYAVLIDGDWGSGKTYFAKHALTEKIEEKEKKAQKPHLLNLVPLMNLSYLLMKRKSLMIF